jgi:hypothetical protein
MIHSRKRSLPAQLLAATLPAAPIASGPMMAQPAHVIRSGDHGGGGTSASLSEKP